MKPGRSAVDLTPYEDMLRTRGELILSVKVIPKSSRNEIADLMADGALKVKVAAAPEKGRANAELCAFLAKVFGVPQRNVSVRSGETSHHKQILISR